jgi:hypothetical protein
LFAILCSAARPLRPSDQENGSSVSKLILQSELESPTCSVGKVQCKPHHSMKSLDDGGIRIGRMSLRF